MRILEVEGLSRHFGGLAAVGGADFYIQKGEIVGLIGPNGAGKTTTFNLVSGTIKPTAGIIRFKGRNITGLKPHEICRRNLARTFQATDLFWGMTALENVLIGGLYGGSSQMSAGRREAAALLEFVGLTDKSETLAKDLTLAEQKRLEIARALATKPELLMLDEVMAGLNPTEVTEAIDLIKSINAKGITILMIEHIMRAIMGMSDRIIVLHYGKKIAEGTPEQISGNKKVVEIYLGE